MPITGLHRALFSTLSMLGYEYLSFVGKCESEPVFPFTALSMEALRLSETSVSTYEPKQRHKPEEHTTFSPP